jgi:predicted dehydrogenase
MTNVCLIGISGFGRVHYADLFRAIARGEVRLRAATVINQPDEPEKCQRLRELGCEIFTDHRAMLAAHARHTDVCFIPTGIHLHAPMTIDALRAGTNVFVEKPAAAVIQDVHAMQVAEHTTGKFVAVGFQDTYSGATEWMKRIIGEGRLGQLRALKMRGIWPRDNAYYTRNNWAGRLRVGDTWVLDAPFHNAFAHFLALLCHLAGEPLASVTAELYRQRDIESPDTACLRIHTVTGIPLLMVVTHAAEPETHPEIIVTGTHDTLRWNYHEVAKLDSGETMACEPPEALRDRMVQMVCRRVTDPQQFICDLTLAGNEVRCANAAFESSPVHRLPAGTDLTPLVLQAYAEGKTFSELGVAWAKPGRRVSLTGYDHYPRA